MKDLFALADAGKKVKALENRPDLLPGLWMYIRAFMDLQSDRQIGMDAGPIPWTSIVNWCHLNGMYDINDIETTVRYIRAMEQAAHDVIKKRSKQNDRR